MAHESVPAATLTPGGTAPDPRRWLAFGVVLAAGFMDVLDTSIVNVAVPGIQRDLHATDGQVEWIVSAYLLSFAALLITGGRLGDIYGRKRVFLAGTAGFTAASLLCGLSVSPTMLIAARLAQGALGGLMVPQVLAIVRVTFPPSERPKAVAIFGAVTGSSSVFGLALGGVLVQGNLLGLGWRPVFLINVPAGIAALVLASSVVRDSRSAAAPRLDLAGMLLAVSAVTLLVYPLTEGHGLGWPAWALAMIAGSAAVLAAFIVFEHRRSATTGSPLIELGLFRSRAFSAGIATWALFWVAMGGFFLTWTLYLQDGLRWTPLHAGLTAATFAIGAGIGAGNSPGRLVPRFGRNVLIAGAAISAVCFAAYAWMAWHYGTAINSWQIIPVQVAAGVGFGMVLAPAIDMLLGQVPAREAGAASGLLNTAQQLGFALGVTLAGIVFFAHTGNYPDAFSRTLRYTAALLAIVCLGFRALPKHPRTPNPHTNME